MPAALDLLSQMQAAQLADGALSSCSNALTTHLAAINDAVEVALAELAGQVVERVDRLIDDSRSMATRARFTCETERAMIQARLVAAPAAAVSSGVVIGFG